MRKGICLIIIILGLSVAAYAQNEPAAGGFYSQLIGFKGGGEFYLGNFKSDWSSGVFFENVMNQWLGLEIEMARTSVPISVYTAPGTTNTITGSGKKDFIEIGGGLKFYYKGLSVGVGACYNNFVTGYIVDTNSFHTPMTDQEVNFFSLYMGPELTAQISADLFAKVGIRFIYGIIQETPNYTTGVRFYISFAYGI